MRFAFSITGDGVAGDEHEMKGWLEHAIKVNNKEKVVDNFKVTVQEVD